MRYLLFKGFCFFVTSTFYSMYNQSSKVVSWVDEMNLLGTGLYFIAIIKNITKMYEDFYLWILLLGTLVHNFKTN